MTQSRVPEFVDSAQIATSYSYRSSVFLVYKEAKEKKAEAFTRNVSDTIRNVIASHTAQAFSSHDHENHFIEMSPFSEGSRRAFWTMMSRRVAGAGPKSSECSKCVCPAVCVVYIISSIAQLSCILYSLLESEVYLHKSDKTDL